MGLTAAVVKDQHTNEFVLEGGSLVLADMGNPPMDHLKDLRECDSR